jgi:hypothetical protein
MPTVAAQEPETIAINDEKIHVVVNQDSKMNFTCIK